ncbi:hypothetical protein HMPREF1547_00840 [Blautia sp. KLE 1732]|nr:hypothetical protein HMPREF1547_00840 [Blautia sp. KLE 1732]
MILHSAGSVHASFRCRNPFYFIEKTLIMHHLPGRDAFVCGKVSFCKKKHVYKKCQIRQK